jgi:branched-chain amino acid transport system permease protein
LVARSRKRFRRCDVKNFAIKNKDNLITYGIVIVAYVVLQTLISFGAVSSLMTGLLVPLCAYIILAVSLNVTVGILGELSLGHAGFMCVGAFTSAFFSKLTVNVITVGWLRFTLAILVGFLCAGLIGFLIGMPVLRLKGDYLAIVTLAFGEIIKNVINVLYIGKDSKGLHFSMKDALALNLEESGEVIVNGAQGITGTPKNSNFTIGVVLILITLFIVLNLIKSRDGRAVMAIRDNVIAAESVGINITKYKLLAFSVSAALAGVAGVLYSHNLSSLMATPKNFGYNMSIMILVFVVLGGIGNIRGSIISAVVLTLLPELLRGLSNFRMLIYAIVLIAMMLFSWSPKAQDFRDKVVSSVFFWRNKENDMKGGIDNAGN